MILTGNEILRAMDQGEIEIAPFDPQGIKTNTYDWRLGNKLLIPRGPLDSRERPEFECAQIEDSGFLLQPRQLYLGETLERTASDVYAQFLNGDRRVGALGVWVHVSAPLGHVGHQIPWTLEIRVVKPVRVYAGMPFGRLVFFRTWGQQVSYASPGAKYLRSVGVEASRLHEELGGGGFR